MVLTVAAGSITLVLMKTTRPGSTVDAAQQIRDALKARGWSSRQVSVRADSFSMGSAIRVLVRDVRVSLAVVKEIAQAHERVRRCEETGEILGGGNRYIDVDYSTEALASLRASIESVLSTVAHAPGAIVEVGGGWRAWRSDSKDYGGEMWRARHSDASVEDIHCCGLSFCARQIAERMAEAASTTGLLPVVGEPTEDALARVLPLPSFDSAVAS